MDGNQEPDAARPAGVTVADLPLGETFDMPIEPRMVEREAAPA